MKSALIQATSVMLALTACSSGPHDTPDTSAAISQKVRDRLALCGAGVSTGVRAKIEAKVGKSLQEGGTLSAEAKQAVQAAFFDGADPTNANVAKEFDTYVKCVDKPL